jgi:protein TonB
MTYVHSLPHFPLPRQAPILAFIVALHVAFIAMINHPIRVPVRQPEFMQGVLVAIERIPPKPAHVPDPRLTGGPPRKLPVPATQPHMVTPDVTAETPPNNADTVGPATTPAETRPAEITSPTIDPRHPIGKPEYPAASRRLGEAGLVVISACVGPDGHIDSVSVQKSSGYPRLDETAARHLRQPGLRMTPGREDGRPIGMCTALPIRFTIDR